MSSRPTVPSPRCVRFASVCFPNGPSLADIAARVGQQGARGCDLLALPETWLGQAGHTPEALDGPTVSAMAALARTHRMYIVCPIDHWDGARRLNTAVLIDRSGSVAGVYHKAFPYWSEYDVQPPVAVGNAVPVFETDFGLLGLAICFDVNFPAVWQQLADGGAELVVWCSAYSAGCSLQAHAINHHYAIATSTQTGDCLVYDISGRLLLDEQGPGVHVSRTMLDLDRGIYHENFNNEPLARLLREHPGDIEIEQSFGREQWFVLRSMRPGISARQLARCYGLEELRAYIQRSRRAIDGMRGAPLPAKA